jgi:hypothetical protein
MLTTRSTPSIHDWSGCVWNIQCAHKEFPRVQFEYWISSLSQMCLRCIFDISLWLAGGRIFNMHIAFIPHLDAFGMVSVHATTNDDEGWFVHHFTSSFNPWIRPNVSDTNIARVNRWSIFHMQVALMTHPDLFVIDIVYAASCGVLNWNIGSHHFTKSAWRPGSISRYAWPVVEDSTCILHSFFISMCLW